MKAFAVSIETNKVYGRAGMKALLEKIAREHSPLVSDAERPLARIIKNQTKTTYVRNASLERYL